MKCHLGVDKQTSDDHSTFGSYTADMSDFYQAYMIRFSRNDGAEPWRVMLRSADNAIIEHFSTERELFLYLMERLETRTVASNPYHQSIENREGIFPQG